METQLSNALCHISHTNNGSNVKCSVIRAVTNKKCKNVINGDTFAPCYEGPCKLPSLKKNQSQKSIELSVRRCSFQANNYICLVNENLN